MGLWIVALLTLHGAGVGGNFFKILRVLTFEMLSTFMFDFHRHPKKRSQ